MRRNLVSYDLVNFVVQLCNFLVKKAKKENFIIFGFLFKLIILTTDPSCLSVYLRIFHSLTSFFVKRLSKNMLVAQRQYDY